MTPFEPGPKSKSLFNEAKTLFPGGVNSPVRSFASVGGEPPIFAKGKGSTLWDADGRPYLDMVQSWGAHLLGHCPPVTIQKIRSQLSRLSSVGAPTAEENKLGALIRQAMPSMEMLRFVSSGTEAVMSALRLARGATGRDLIVKFDGCYHGHADNLLVSAGSGLATLAMAASAGVPASAAAQTISVPYNDLPAVAAAFAVNSGRIAALIVEPLAANMGVVKPEPGFLQGLRTLCDQNGALLVFDEVITGFRIGWGGAQGYYGVKPDLTTLGKIIGGGLPVGAYGGRTELIQLIAPLGPVYQAGTLSGNPLAMVAGASVLDQVRDGRLYTQIEERATTFYAKLASHLNPEKHCLNHQAGLFTLFFCGGPVSNFAQAKTSDTQAYARFFHTLLGRGIFLPPAQFEASFIGAAHTRRHLSQLAEECARALDRTSAQ